MSTLRTSAFVAALAALVVPSVPASAAPEAALLIEAETGRVLHAENATMPWYPASITKVMTAYVTLQAVKQRRITLDTLLTVSQRAYAQQPSKIGFKPGTKITVDNALKILMVKSANDVAVVLAEGVSGSVEKFAGEMNAVSKRLGMTQSSWVNPNGLPAENQISSARDLAILARAALHDFPEYGLYWRIPGVKLGKRVMRNYNTLIGRYDGADGMKTGFICASGFNLLATATRKGKQLIAVVLGSPSSAYRGAKTAGLLERGFSRGALSWLTPSLGSVETLQPINAAPPDLRDSMCGPHRKRPAAEEADDDSTTAEGSDSALGFMLSSLPPGGEKPSSLLSSRSEPYVPIVVHAGPPKRPAESQFAAIRAKLAKEHKIKSAQAFKRDPHVAPIPLPQSSPVPLPQPSPSVTASASADAAPAPATAAKPAPADRPAAEPRQVASVGPAPGAFGPPPTQFKRSRRALPAATDLHNPSWMSFAPAARAESAPPPLTATPDAKPELKVALVPMPRPRPKIVNKRKPRRR